MPDDPHCATCTCYVTLPDPRTNRKGKHHRPPGGEEEEAARLIEPSTGIQRMAVLDAIAYWDDKGGVNDANGSRWAGVRHQSWLGRVGELVDDGWVTWGEQKSPTGYGGTGRHRVLTPRGRQQFREMFP